MWLWSSAVSSQQNIRGVTSIDKIDTEIAYFQEKTKCEPFIFRILCPNNALCHRDNDEQKNACFQYNTEHRMEWTQWCILFLHSRSGHEWIGVTPREWEREGTHLKHKIRWTPPKKKIIAKRDW